jgi:hypothetical protein
MDIDNLVGKEGYNFKWARRIELKDLTQRIIDEHTALGTPLVVSNCTQCK